MDLGYDHYTYCFAKDINFNREKNVTYLSEKQFELIKQLPQSIKLIMLGCDTEFFQNKAESLRLLNQLANLNKDISVITKLSLPRDFIKKLKGIDYKLRQHNNLLAFSVSILCLDSVKTWEPRAPSPEQRMETLRDAYDLNHP